MGSTINMGIKTLDAIIPLLQTRYEVRAIENNSLVE